MSDYLGSTTDSELRALCGLVRSLPALPDVRQAVQAYATAPCRGWDDETTLSLSSDDQSVSTDDSFVECDANGATAADSAVCSCDSEASAEDGVSLDDDVSDTEDRDMTPREWD